ncbi:hypothetical protein SR870_06945 [Rhodopseudomonas palustris]|uniref:hypothetical protein n=1 Tax=Rhodopseudomonas palustris TaxID=1076 RepID=UPI002ACDF756|nr:hypothetical protein [Rhodopseudomonas palustris]WQH01007.1 hypothetical protein SR870_06945 [Rhodopseudomonas palustris]
MRIVYAVVVFALLAGSAFGQTAPMQKYGDPDPEKSRTEIEAEKQAEKAYQRSLSNVPNATGPVDPWGNVRGGDAQKAAAKPAPAKRAKPANPSN